MRKLLLILLIISFAAMAVATVLTVSGVGPAAAGENTLPDPVGTVDKVYYVFSGGQITDIKVDITWSTGLPAGTYTIRVEAVDTDVSPPNVLASGETTETNPTGTVTYTIDLSPDLGFSGIQDFDTVRVYIVQTA